MSQIAVTNATPTHGMVSAACWIGPDRRLNAITSDEPTRIVSPAASSNFRSEVRIPRRPAATVAPGTFWAIIEASLHGRWLVQWRLHARSSRDPFGVLDHGPRMMAPVVDLTSVGQQLVDRIRDRTARIGIVGLGYVGLPTAVGYAPARFTVVGSDNG